MSEVEIEAQRRRLSLGVCDPVPSKNKGSSDETAASSNFGEDTNRGLMTKLNATTIIKACENLETSTGSPLAQRRRMSLSSSTDAEQKDKPSFEEKTHVCEGEDKITNDMLQKMGIGIACRKGLKPESPNQDSFSFTYVGGESGFSLYGVYDGHGPVGHDVSQFVKEMLPKLIVNHASLEKDPETAFRDSYVKCQELIQLQQDEKKLDASLSGCTTSVVYRPHHDQFIVVSHVGDSRAVLASSTKSSDIQELTIDHKPNLPEEKARIESRGGRVVFDGFYNHRVFAKDAMYPGLNMSRALGDTLAHRDAGITATPDVLRVPILKQSSDKAPMLMVCTDGVWEFIESDEAVKMVIERKNNMAKAAADLAQESWNRWLADSGGEISDDITVFLVDLGKSQDA